MFARIHAFPCVSLSCRIKPITVPLWLNHQEGYLDNVRAWPWSFSAGPPLANYKSMENLVRVQLNDQVRSSLRCYASEPQPWSGECTADADPHRLPNITKCDIFRWRLCYLDNIVKEIRQDINKNCTRQTDRDREQFLNDVVASVPTLTVSPYRVQTMTESCFDPSNKSEKRIK
jgi:hypothetical protein